MSQDLIIRKHNIYYRFDKEDCSIKLNPGKKTFSESFPDYQILYYTI